MTSYSTYATNSMRLTPEGDLPTDLEVAEDYLQRMTSCLAAGIARTWLDSGKDEDDNDTNAVEWHSAHEGWELDALDDELRQVATWMAGAVLANGFHHVNGFANWLAFHDRISEPVLWTHDYGMSLYRVGQLIGHQVLGDGVGPADYVEPGAYKLDDWISNSGLVGSVEGLTCDGSETPTLLHGSIYHGLREMMQTAS